MTGQGWRLPDGLLDDTHAWNNDTDRAEYEKAFREGSLEERLMAAALTCADPSTPQAAIRRQLSVRPGTNAGTVNPNLVRTQPSLDVCFQTGDNNGGIGKTIWDVNTNGNVQSSIRNSQEILSNNG